MNKDTSSRYIIEAWLTVIFLVLGIVLKDTTYFIASGLFAIAMQIGMGTNKRN